MNKNFFKISGVALSTMLMVACGNLSNVSKEGTTNEPVFPKIEKQKFNHDGTQTGTWVNWDNLRQIEKGMNKDQVYNLIGRPHHNEGLYGVREWDYTFNYNEYNNGKKEFKQCQYKILFDKDMNVGETYWYPNGCNGYFYYKLESDFLFDFDKDILTKEGLETINNIANELKNNDFEKVEVYGYTDRFGSEEYNQNLSERRANTVATKLFELGVKADFIIKGMGEHHPIKFCNGNGKEAKDCLKPNRRVEIKTKGKRMVDLQEEKKAGKIGPYPYYDKTYPQIINQ